MFADGDLTHLCLRCLGVHVVHVVELQKAGGGMLSQMYQRVTGSKHIKSEKRTIKILQTNPFPAGVTSNFSPVENCVFTSEVFDDLTMENGIASGLVADIRCPRDYDCRLTVLVQYTSSVCSREITLASGSFSFQQLLAHAVNSTSSYNVFQVQLQSDFCLGAKAYIDIVHPFAPIGTCSSIHPFAVPTQRGQPGMNPLRSRYVFYNRDDSSCPAVDVEETTWEPRLTNQIPLLVLENFLAALTQSMDAWSVRRSLEKIRQGLFESTADAYKNGWQQVKVTVHGAHLGSSRDRESHGRDSSPRDSRGTVSTVNGGGIARNSASSGMSGGDDRRCCCCCY